MSAAPGPVDVHIAENADGTQTVSYKPTVAGEYTLDLAIDGAPIKKAQVHSFSDFCFHVFTLAPLL